MFGSKGERTAPWVSAARGLLVGGIAEFGALKDSGSCSFSHRLGNLGGVTEWAFGHDGAAIPFFNLLSQSPLSRVNTVFRLVVYGNVNEFVFSLYRDGSQTNTRLGYRYIANAKSLLRREEIENSSKGVLFSRRCSTAKPAL